jgi:hypothetical protein
MIDRIGKKGKTLTQYLFHQESVLMSFCQKELLKFSIKLGLSALLNSISISN